jgi:hypothetical protein
MSIIERVLEPNSTETPTCICGKDMRLAKIRAVAVDTETRDFDCECGHLMKLMIWTDQVLSSNFVKSACALA